MARELESNEDPRRTLRRAAVWLCSVGAVVAVAGIIALVIVLRGADGSESGEFWRIFCAIGAIGCWFIPGVLMTCFGLSIPRRKRWAITGAEVTCYIQMFFAGALIVFSLLHVKALWPMLLVNIAWIVPLLFTHMFTGPCSRAMDLMAQMVTLGTEPGRLKRQ